MSTFTFAATLPGSIAELRPRVEAALKDEGYGILTEIDVAATLKAKLDVDRDPYLILGACNPHLASRALDIDPSIGAVLPCNVVLRTSGRETVVEIIDPLVALGVTGAPELMPLAVEATERLRRALQAVVGSSAAPSGNEGSSAQPRPALT